MHSKIVFLFVFAIAIGSVSSAYAHKYQVIDEYKIEIGWDKEPPIQGIKNSIELIVTHATEAEKQKAANDSNDKMDMKHDEEHDDMKHDEEHDDMKHDEEHDDMKHDEEHDDMKHDEEHDHMKHDEEGVSGLDDTINVTVTLDGKTSTVTMTETEIDGIYHGEFTPHSAGFPVIHLSGMINNSKVELDMHPEEVESISILPPLKQIDIGIEPSDVQCKEGLELFMRIHEDSSICASSGLGQRLMELGVVTHF